MNVTTRSIPPSNWKRLQAWHFSLAAGLALAASAAVVFEPSVGTSSPAASQRDPMVASWVRQPEVKQHTFYIVASESERAALLRYDASVPRTEPTSFRKVDPAQGTLPPAFSVESAQYVSLQEQVLVALSGADMRVGALANETTDNAVVSVLVAGSPAADALVGEGSREMMSAGVRFTIIDTTVARQPFAIVPGEASEADILASVLSTERAAWAE